MKQFKPIARVLSQGAVMTAVLSLLQLMPESILDLAVVE